MGISGLVTFIAAYHYIRIFNSWVESYEYTAGEPDKYGALFIEAPKLTGVPFNDAYRYMDWLLTVPLLLIEILLVMKLPDDVFSAKGKIQQAQAWTVVSWCTYPVVYLFPMVGLGGCRSVVNIQ